MLLSGRDQGRGGCLSAEIAGAGGAADFVAADLRDAGACAPPAAGVLRRGNAEETGEWDRRQTMAVTLDAAFFLPRAMLPLMR